MHGKIPGYKPKSNYTRGACKVCGLPFHSLLAQQNFSLFLFPRFSSKQILPSDCSQLVNIFYQIIVPYNLEFSSVQAFISPVPLKQILLLFFFFLILLLFMSWTWHLPISCSLSPALLRYNLPTIIFSLLKYSSVVFRLFSLKCVTITTLQIPDIFIAPKGSHPRFPLPSSPWKPLVYFLSLWLCLSWTRYKRNHTICGWPFVSGFFFFSLSTMLSQLSHAVACIHTSFLLLWLNNIPLCGHTTLVYLFISWWIFELVHFLTTRNHVAMNIHGKVCVWSHVIISLG